MAAILIVEDSLDAVELIRRALGFHELSVAYSIAEARQWLQAGNDFDLMLLDLNIPDGDGLAFCSEISSGGETQLPVMILSARDDVRDKVTAFALGAEDYIQKPCDSLELQARVSARLRKLEAARVLSDVLECGDLRIEIRSLRVFHERAEGARELDLSPTEHRILHALAERSGRLVTRETLMSEIWGDTIVGPRTIDSHVSKLRSKIRGSRGRIDSVRGLGYRFRVASDPAERAAD